MNEDDDNFKFEIMPLRLGKKRRTEYNDNELYNVTAKLYGWQLSASDVVLVLFGLEPDKPIYSRKKYQMSLFLFYKELDKKGYAYENPHFIPSREGPFSYTLVKVLDNLVWSSFIKTEGQYNKETEAFMLTDKGKTEALGIIEEKIRKEDLEDLKLFRMSIDQYTVQGISRYVYAHYPQFKVKHK